MRTSRLPILRTGGRMFSDKLPTQQAQAAGNLDEMA